MKSRREIIEGSYRDYQKSNKKGKKEILDRLVPITGLNRDYLAHALASRRETAEVVADGKSVKLKAAKGKRKARPEGKRGGRRAAYGEEFRQVLETLWQSFGRPCGKLPVPMVREIKAFLVTGENDGYVVTAEMRELLLKVSPAEADILLKPIKKAEAIRGISTTRAAGVSLRSQVPGMTHYDRKTVTPGSFAFDTVAHCGGSASGQFCKTLTGTDIATGWVEERALLNAANRWVKEEMTAIESDLPFPMKEAHFDNGMEFINKPLLDWLLERHIEATRSRPYKKNDNCFAEQKNYDVVRKNVGYFRFDTPEEQAQLGVVYGFLCPLYNYFMPSFRLIDKVPHSDGRYKKVYEKQPKTPFARLIESPDVSEACKAQLRRRKALYNPIDLNKRLNEAVEKLLKLNREKVYTNNTSCQEVA